MNIGNAVSERQENAVGNEGTNGQDFTVGTSNSDSFVNGNAMSVKTLERCFNEKIDRKMSNIVDTVENRIQNACLTAVDNIVTPKIELAIRSINASSGRYVTSVSANSERREQVGINASFENASGNDDTLGVSNVNDETRHNIPDKVSELLVPETHFDRQPHTHHSLATLTRANGKRGIYFPRNQPDNEAWTQPWNGGWSCWEINQSMKSGRKRKSGKERELMRAKK